MPERRPIRSSPTAPNGGLRFIGAGIGTSNAGAANITVNGGFLIFDAPKSTAGAATITNNGLVNFFQTAVAGTANIANNASLLFTNSSSAENATVHTTGGALTQFLENASGGRARFITDAGGIFDISNTVVPVTVGSIEGAGLHLLGGSQLITGLNNLSTTVSGEISGIGGSLVKTGSGTLMLSGINSYTGQTIVQAGALIVDGSIAPSSLTTVQAGALLGGSGTVGSSTIAGGGTFAPGPSGAPGTMTVAGNLAFQSGALYLVKVNPTAASTADVTGTATLAGTVQANFAPGSYLNRSYTILSAAGGRTGTFDALTTSGLPAGFQPTLTYTGTAAVLNLTAQLPPASGGNVGTAIANSFNAGVPLPPAFVAVFAAPDLSPLTGEAATGAQKVGFQLTDQFLNLMLDPFVDGRSGVGDADHPALGFAPERPIMPPEIALAYASVFKAPPKAAPVYEPRWTVWGGAYGGSNRTTGDLAVTGSHDLSARTVGVAGGLDYHLTPDTVVGLAFAGGGTDWKLSQGLGPRQERRLPGGYLRRDEIRPGLSRRGLRLRQSLDVHRPPRLRRPSDRRLQLAELRRAARRRLPLRHVLRWDHAIRRDPGAELPHAELHRDRVDPQRLCAHLQWPRRDRYQERTRRTLRPGAGGLFQCGAGAARAGRLGA